MHTNSDIEEYRKLFWDAFHRPKFKSDRYKAIWLELELINDVLAGPFFSMYENGHIQYVFDDHERFPKVNTIAEFKIWASYLINVYHDEVESTDKPEGADEEYDLQVLRFQTETKNKLMGLIEKICG
jgi:hypothetical protein